MDGLTATREVRRLPQGQHVPIVAMTANAMVSDREACLEAGMNDHVGKPFVLRELVSKILQWTGRKEAASPDPSPTAPDGTPQPPPSPTLGGAAAPPFNLEAALQRLDGNATLHARLTAQFLADLPQLMVQAMDVNDRETAQRALHSMKGVALTIGADALAQLCSAQEQRVKAGGSPDTQALTATAEAAVAAIRAAMPEAPAPAPAGDQPPLTDAERAELEGLLPLLEAADIAAFDVVEQYPDAGDGSVWTRLSQALDLMDFESAAAIAKEALASPAQG
jgi:CheY-like chemotaxis protein